MRPTPKMALLALAITLFVTQGIVSQVTSESPEQFVGRYLEMSKTDAVGTVKLMHPEALLSFKTLLTPLFEVKPPTVGTEILSVKNADAYAALSPEEVYVRFISYIYRTSPGFGATIGASEMKVLGGVTEGELVHVLYRMKVRIADVSVDKVEIITVKKNGSGWAAMLSGDYEGLVDAIVKRPVGQPPTPKRKRT